MNINLKTRRFSSPLGNYKHPGVGRCQSKVGKCEAFGYGSVNDSSTYFDCVKAWQESEGDRFVKGPHSIETIRR